MRCRCRFCSNGDRHSNGYVGIHRRWTGQSTQRLPEWCRRTPGNKPFRNHARFRKPDRGTNQRPARRFPDQWWGQPNYDYERRESDRSKLHRIWDFQQRRNHLHYQCKGARVWRNLRIFYYFEALNNGPENCQFVICAERWSNSECNFDRKWCFYSTDFTVPNVCIVFQSATGDDDERGSNGYSDQYWERAVDTFEYFPRRHKSRRFYNFWINL